jgi:arylformamidase
MDLTEAYTNAAYIPDGAAYPARWAARAADFRAARPPEMIVTGPGPREVAELFLPNAPPHGLMVFVHGGYWRAFSPQDFSHLAAGALARGWAVALPGYPLAPLVRIATISRSVARSIAVLAGRVPGPVRLAGHSAGGHLVARAVSADMGLAVIERVERVVPVSPVAEVAPLMDTAMNSDLQIDADEAARESPARHRWPPCPVHVWVGGAERPAFIDQADQLARAWAAPLTVEPERHHFDVIEGLERPDSPLMAAILD